MSVHVHVHVCVNDFNFVTYKVCTCKCTMYMYMCTVHSHELMSMEKSKWRDGDTCTCTCISTCTCIFSPFILFRSFPILEVHFPKYSTREIHRNYIDCVRWFGRLAFSKSCENSLILWRPPRPDDKPQEKSFQVLQK